MIRDKLYKKITDEAIDVFKDHKLISSTDDRWFIASQYDNGASCGIFATEIISLHNGRLFVGGDISDVVFGYSGGNHIGKVYWIGWHEQVDSYIEEKACIGMRVPSVTEYDEDAAKEDLKDLLEDVRQGYLDRDLDPENHEIFLITKDAINDAIKDVNNEVRMKEDLYNDIGNPDFAETIGKIGKVYDTKLFYAWAACRRLCELLGS